VLVAMAIEMPPFELESMNVLNLAPVVLSNTISALVGPRVYT
jgi:hypothetical protein